MEYIVGIDGGGSKTVCALADKNGQVVAVTSGSCSNHQICGFDQAIEVITRLIHSAVRQADIKMSDISFIGMGLAGADTEQDIEMLSKELAKTLEGIPFEIVNDIWIAFWAEASNTWGAVSVCGTGANIGVRTPKGKVLSVRALRYPLGNYGGGKHLSDIATHYAFRSNEYTGDYTMLEQFLPSCCQAVDMDDLAAKIYDSNYTYHYQYDIPKLVFGLADEGDEVSRKILSDMGFEMGSMMGGLIEAAKLSTELEVPIVLSGSLYVHDENAFIINGFKKALDSKIERYELKVLHRPPVLGAIFFSLEKTGQDINEEMMNAVLSHLMRCL